MVAWTGIEPVSQPYKDYALPLSYQALNLVEGVGIEPTTTRGFNPVLYRPELPSVIVLQQVESGYVISIPFHSKVSTHGNGYDVYGVKGYI